MHSHYCVCTGESVHIITYKPSHSVICHAAAPIKEGGKKRQCVSKLSSFSLSLVSLSLCFLSVSVCVSLSLFLSFCPPLSLPPPPPPPPVCLINQGYLLIFSVMSLSSLGLPVFSIMLPPFPAPFMVMMMMMRWSSPQLLVHGGELTQNSDSWGVGCVLYEMLTGARPWYHLRHCRKEDTWQQVMFHPHLLACVVAV